MGQTVATRRANVGGRLDTGLERPVYRQAPLRGDTSSPDRGPSPPAPLPRRGEGRLFGDITAGTSSHAFEAHGSKPHLVTPSPCHPVIVPWPLNPDPFPATAGRRVPPCGGRLARLRACAAA